MTDTIISNGLISSYLNFKTQSDSRKFIFSYRGRISHSIVKTLLSMTEKKMDQFQEEKTVRTKIFAVMVNCLQNICAEEKKHDTETESVFLISKELNCYTVFTGRYLKSETALKLSDLIESINQLDKDSLIEMKKSKLKELHASGDAFSIDETTLSLIDIARRSNQKINYLIETSSGDESFFSIKVQIS